MAQATGNGARKIGGTLAIAIAVLLFAAAPFQLAAANPAHGGGSGGSFHAGGSGFHGARFTAARSTGTDFTAARFTAASAPELPSASEGSTRPTCGIMATLTMTTTVTIPIMAIPGTRSPMPARFGITAPTPPAIIPT